MKKFVSILLTCLLFASCENFLTDNLDSAKKMAEEVRFNTAAQILVTVFSESGTVVTGSNRDARVGIPFEIELSLPKSVGVFEKWYAVVRDKDNNETLLTSDDIVFENENSLKTNVTLLNELKGVYVIAKVQENPVLSITYDNIDFYSKNSTNESKGLHVNDNRISENGSFSYQNFVIQTTNDYEISFDRISFCSNDGFTETQIPVYTLNEFYALGENIPKPYTYIINCEDGNPETGSDENGSFYTSAVTNALLCLFNVSENSYPEGAVKVSFNACLFHSLSNMVYVKPTVDAYLKVFGNVEGYENTTITPNAPKVILPSKDVVFKISIPDQYSYESLSFKTESGTEPKVYITQLDSIDDSLEEVKDAAFAVFSLNVDTSETTNYETKTNVSFNVKSINGFSEPIIVKPVLKKNSVLVPASKKNESFIEPNLSEVRLHPGKDYDFSVSSVVGYNLSDLIFTDESNNIFYTYNQVKYDSLEEKPNNYIFISDSKVLDENLDSVKNSLYAIYNFIPVLDEYTGEVRANFKIRVIKGYDKKLKFQADTYVKNTVNTPSGKIVAHPGKEYSIKFSSDNSYTFDSITVSTPSNFIPFYTEEEYNNFKPALNTYAYYSANSSFDSSSEAVKNSILSVYDVSISTSEGRNYESISNASFKFRLINEINSNITISPVTKFKKTINFIPSQNSSVSPSGEIKTLSSNGIDFSIDSTDQYAISAILIKDASDNIICRYETAGKSSVPENIYLEDTLGNNIILIKNAKLETNLSKISGTLFVQENISQSISIEAETKIRPFIQSTEPYSFEKDVMRTSPIIIRFSKPMKSFDSDPDAYLNYFNVIRCDNAGVLNGDGENVFQEILSGDNAHPRYFMNPELKENNYQILISPVNNTNEPFWMKSGSEVRVSIDKTFTDEEGIPLKDDYTFSYTLGTKGDSFGPIMSLGELYVNGTKVQTSVYDDWKPINPSAIIPGKTYADSIRVTKDAEFTFKATADDSNTGNTGISKFIASVKLVYIPEGGRIPNSLNVATRDMVLFDSEGNWNSLGGALKTDCIYEKVFSYDKNNVIASTNDYLNQDVLSKFTLEEKFKTTNNLPVDGIYRIEITAVDKLENRSSNSSVYYIVRDTTPPVIDYNIQQLAFSEDSGLDVTYDGYTARMFSKAYDFVCYINNKPLVDSFNTTLPSISCSSDLIEASYILSSSPSVLSASTIKAESNWGPYWTIEFPTQILETDNKVLYTWVKFRDDLNNETTPVCVPSLSFTIDNTKPKIPTILESQGISFDTSVTPNKLYVDSSVNTFTLSSEDLLTFPIVNGDDVNKTTGNVLFAMKKSSDYYYRILPSNTYTLPARREYGNYDIIAIDELDNRSPVLTFTLVENSQPVKLALKKVENYYSNNGNENTLINSYTANNGSNGSVYCYQYSSGYRFNGLLLDSLTNPSADRQVVRNTKVNNKTYVKNNFYLELDITDSILGFDTITVDGFKILEKSLNSNNNYLMKNPDGSLSFNLPKINRVPSKVYTLKLKGQLNDISDGEKNISVNVRDKTTTAKFDYVLYNDNTPPVITPNASDDCIKSSYSFNGEDYFAVGARVPLSGDTTAWSSYSAQDINGVGGVYYQIEDLPFEGEDTSKSYSYIYSYLRTEAMKASSSSITRSDVKLQHEHNDIYLKLEEVLDPNMNKYYSVPNFSIRTKSKDTENHNHRFRISAYDSLGNKSSVITTVEYDTSGPIFNVDTSTCDYTSSSGLIDSFSEEGTRITVIDNGSGLQKGIVKQYAGTTTTLVDAFNFTGEFNSFILKDYSPDYSGTKYTISAIDNLGNENTKDFTVKFNLQKQKPKLISYSLMGIDNYGQKVTGFFKDEFYLSLQPVSRLGFITNGIKLPLQNIEKSNYDNNAYFEGDYIPVSNGFTNSNQKDFEIYGTSEVEEFIIKMEDVYHQVTANSVTTLKKDEFGPLVSYSMGPDTKFLDNNYDTSKNRRLNDDGTIYSGHYIEYTGSQSTPKCTVYIKLSDNANKGSDKYGNAVEFPAGGGIYPSNKGKVTKKDNILSDRRTNDPVWDASNSRWVLTLTERNKTYQWVAYDRFDNPTLIELTIKK